MIEHDNLKYFENTIIAFKRFATNNIDTWRNDKDKAREDIKYALHCFGAGLFNDDTIKEILSTGYSRMIVSALLGTSVGVAISAKEWSQWVSERIGFAYQ